MLTLKHVNNQQFTNIRLKIYINIGLYVRLGAHDLNIWAVLCFAHVCDCVYFCLCAFVYVCAHVWVCDLARVCIFDIFIKLIVSRN